MVVMVVAMLIAACANIGSPDGGPYDEKPPVIVHTSPQLMATNVSSRKVVLEFDENIRIDNAVEKVVVSPPQVEAPEISASGHRITVELIDSLQPQTTYTIDFADAIEDNNEGNPMGDYAFIFSTGDSIDTMQVSGYVLDASNLEPIKGIMVGLYVHDDSTYVPADDSTFTSVPFERISRTDSRGHFVIKGLARKPYKIFALQDQDQSFSFSQKSEMIAFTERLFVPYCKPDLRPDTVWHDSLHYDSIVMRPYTHFFPDDITLLAFNPPTSERFFLKAERPNLWQFTLYFTNKSDTLPVVEGLNFDATDAFEIWANATNDTITYWLRDSLVYNLDTLSVSLRFLGTDTLGQFSLITDTLDLVSKISRERQAQLRQREYDEWLKEYRERQKSERRRVKAESKRSARGGDNEEMEMATDSLDAETALLLSDSIPPMPEDFLNILFSGSSLDPDANPVFRVDQPVAVLDTSRIHFFQMSDSLRLPRPYIIRQVNNNPGSYYFFAEWEPDSVYEIAVDTSAIVDLYGKRNAAFTQTIRVRGEDSYGYIRVGIDSREVGPLVVQLINTADKPVKTVYTSDHVAEFFYVQPGTYYLRLFVDRNENRQWDPGDLDLGMQPESMYYYPGALTVRAGWDLSQDWNPLATPIYRQKPEKITKQKPDKEKTIKNRNAEREKNKRK